MKNNKGFSLVELIIVIAIMAILVGVMAPQLIKYIEKTNVSADIQLCDSVRTALTTASMDPDVVRATNGGSIAAGTGLSVNSTNITLSVKTEAESILGVSLDNIADKLKSKSAKGHSLTYDYDGTAIVVQSSNDPSIYAGK